MPARCLRVSALRVFDLASRGDQADACVLKGASGLAVFVQQAKKQMLGADVVMVERLGFLLRQHHHPPGGISESLEHANLPLVAPSTVGLPTLPATRAQ